MSAAQPPSISPAALLERLVTGTPTTLLDVRREAAGGIEAAAATTLHVPAGDVEKVADDVPAGAVLVCQRGVTATKVAERLDGAVVLEGGLRAWLGVLKAFPVALDLSSAEVWQVQRPGRGCLSYFVAAGGEALVVDPAPDPEHYLDLAARTGSAITTVFDTHLHADHLSGARTLAERADAELLLPRETTGRLRAPIDGLKTVADGDSLRIGPLTVGVLALPGHTTDMTGLLVGGRALISGDSLLPAGVARPDLEFADAPAVRDMARVLHRTLHHRILALDPNTRLLGAHDRPLVRDRAVAPTLAETRAALGALIDLGEEPFASAILTDMPPRPENYEAIIAANAGAGQPDPELEQGGNACVAG